jgi:allantoate deiminase
VSAAAAAAREVIRRCRELAHCSDLPSCTDRRFLSPAMHDVHRRLRQWMEGAGMTVHVDAAGNIRGAYAPSSAGRRAGRGDLDDENVPRLIVASHLDTVPNAGAFDGILGVVMGVAVVEACKGRRLPFVIEVVGFSEEEGVRFGAPFIGSRAFVGDLDAAILGRRDDAGVSVAEAIAAFGLDPAALPAARFEPPVLGYLEFHIEQGPVLDGLGVPLGIVEAIAGQSRLELTFTGAANHAGTTPMARRRDALAGAAEWIGTVERHAAATPGLVATVGRIHAAPGAANVVPGVCLASLDLRHPADEARTAALARIRHQAHGIASRRGLALHVEVTSERAAMPMDAELSGLLERSAASAGVPAHRMPSGAGHDAMIVARYMPAAMLFLRTPGGISHHPDETVNEDDVAAGLTVAAAALDELARRHG